MSNAIRTGTYTSLSSAVMRQACRMPRLEQERPEAWLLRKCASFSACDDREVIVFLRAEHGLDACRREGCCTEMACALKTVSGDGSIETYVDNVSPSDVKKAITRAVRLVPEPDRIRGTTAATYECVAGKLEGVSDAELIERYGKRTFELSVGGVPDSVEVELMQAFQLEYEKLRAATRRDIMKIRRAEYARRSKLVESAKHGSMRETEMYAELDKDRVKTERDVLLRKARLRRDVQELKRSLWPKANPK